MCWGENRDDFQRETGRVLCLILQFFLPTQAPCSLSDTYSSLLETHFCTECCCLSCSPGPLQLQEEQERRRPQPGCDAGTCSVPLAGGVGTGERELSFSFPNETSAGSISHYTTALKSQAAHRNLLLWGYSSRRGCYINAFILMRKQAEWKDLF